MFLRGCKFSLERTKEKLDFHHAVRGGLPSWFADWDPRLPAVQVSPHLTLLYLSPPQFPVKQFLSRPS